MEALLQASYGRWQIAWGDEYPTVITTQNTGGLGLTLAVPRSDSTNPCSKGACSQRRLSGDDKSSPLINAYFSVFIHGSA